ncbi:Poly-beta-1,6-N-acetyl-D-glucosamine synthase [Terricaulis silvestris]|uniref:Poly-beta-1,6-N-acetyl-D-glucosamine synthase n=1 Tax=Terricaulis silvestris TaxID=2686094 RepID=A0A6I6MUB4_9CAUL|nr:Poly-beta-1,6-N-acetyl-D-glucosamine synthase [Terricaulis silvestris]
MDGGEPRLDGLRPVATVSAAELDAARLAFHRAFPARSSKRVFFATQVLALTALIGLIVWAFAAAPALSFEVAHIAALCLFALAIGLRLVAAASLAPILWRLAKPQQWPVYTVLCPLYREANIVPDLVAALNALDYPANALDVKLLVEGDDVDTIAAALAASSAPHIEIVIVPAAAPRTKPKALNVGLARARGEFVVVYDAEDRPHPQQLLAALGAFEDGDGRLACVQAPLVIDNADANWIARQFASEYAIQFREVLPLLARMRVPVSLGGSSNHFRTEALRTVGGWDSYNVTEDADLGYRFARDGYRIDVIGPPTYEEAPVTFAAWLNQRTRWIKGHMQTWLVLMRDPIRTAREMGVVSFAMMHLMLSGGLVAAFLHGPIACVIAIAALSPYTLLTPADFVLALCGYCVAIFAALTACALSNSLSHARAALTMPAYWPLASIAAYRALFALLFRPHRWAKTAHGVSPRIRMLDPAR